MPTSSDARCGVRMRFRMLRRSNQSPLDRAERCLRRFLEMLEYIGPVGKKILDSESVYLGKDGRILLRGDDADPLDLEDRAFLRATYRRFKEKYGHILELTRTKNSLFSIMVALSKEGNHILEQDELYLSGDEIRWRGNGVEPDFEDVGYWTRKLFSFDQALFKIRQKTKKGFLDEIVAVKDRSSSEPSLSESASSASSPTSLPGPHLSRLQDRVESWLREQPGHPAVLESFEPSLADGLAVNMPGTPPESVGNLSDCSSTFHHHKGSMYMAMKNLERAGPDGQRVLDADELQIDDSTEVMYRWADSVFIPGHKIVYRGSQNMAPNLRDREYWFAKYKHFTLEALRVGRLTQAKSDVYDAMKKLERCGSAGERVLNDHELYIAGPSDVRRRESRDGSVDLQDPQYWEDQLKHFQLHLPAPQAASSLASAGSKRTRVDDAGSSTSAESRNKRQRLSCSGTDQQQTDRSDSSRVTTLRHSPPASNAVTRDNESAQRGHAEESEPADTGASEPSNALGSSKRPRVERPVHGSGGSAVETLVAPSPAPMPRQKRKSRAQPRRQSSKRLVDGNGITTRGHKNKQASLGTLPSARQTRSQKRGGQQRLGKAQDRLARNTHGKTGPRRSRRLAGQKPEYGLDGQAQ
ncbi:hypothetical protein XA68_17114 [Ophiocordyceps unilateralis]|uniref:Uncharacterized protein n=1 Tax=Ophiocordyceps unilateralis TaxID=268505 RepID=A0A2A9P5B3_OPHUN|nr:hypothetical protein XA68_17114 [Ophiocordyceps unilateralis]